MMLLTDSAYTGRSDSPVRAVPGRSRALGYTGSPVYALCLKLQFFIITLTVVNQLFQLFLSIIHLRKTARKRDAIVSFLNKNAI